MSEEAPSALGEVEEGLQERFSNLRIEGLIARGGMGAVYRAVQTQLDRSVALKILPDEFAVDEVRRNLFVREARAMAKLSHPHLVQLFDFGENDGLWFMVQEWVKGKTLFDHQQIGVLEIDDGVRLVREVCAGLQHAHENGVVHRDIKPANILIDPDGAVKLTDFGLAQSVGGEASDEEESEEDCFGTPEYAAPELFVPGATIDHRADIFAVGVLLFEILTGEQPAAVYRHPSEVIADLGTRFDAMIAKAMQHNPDDRYQSCAEFDGDLYNALTGAEAEASKPRLLNSGIAPGTRPVSITASGVANLSSAKSGGGSTLGVLVGVIAVVAGFYFFLKSDGEDEPENDQEDSEVLVAQGVDSSSSEKEKQPEKIKEADKIAEKPVTPPKEEVVKEPETPEPEERVLNEELIALENELKRKVPAMVGEYDAKMKTLKAKYLSACRKAAKGKSAGIQAFWANEAAQLKESGNPSEVDDGIPDRALVLRKAWREHEEEASQELRRLHLDTTERYELLIAELQRSRRMKESRKAHQRAVSVQTFASFMDFCRQQMGKKGK